MVLVLGNFILFNIEKFLGELWIFLLYYWEIKKLVFKIECLKFKIYILS